MQAIYCPRCGQTLAYVPELVGHGVSCPKCQARFAMPQLEDEAPAAPPAPPFVLSSNQPARSSVVRRKPKDLTIPMVIFGTCACVAVVMGMIALALPSESGGSNGSARATINNTFDQVVSTIPGLVVLAMMAALYFTPTVIAFFRKHPNAAAIAALNILLGFTFIGWVASLVWSLTEVRSRDHYHFHARGR